MTTDTEVTDVTVVTELANKNGETGQSEVEKEKEMDVLLIQIKSRKRTAKTKITKLRHKWKGHHDDRNRFLKPLKIPTFNGD